MMFVCAFEMASGFSRKNSLGAIDAFTRAFGPEEDAFLVVKVNNAQGFPEPLSSLRQRARSDPRIIVVDEVLSYPEVLSLYASADAFVSLHRAEGLGLCLLEAMSLGKPAIATGWSGNMDFMTEQNGCLVGYSLVPVHDETQAAYRPEFAGPGARWAEPRLEEAVHWMRRLAEDSELRERIGKRAGADMAERHARLSTDELLAAIRHVQEVKGSASR
jgi:glycosyltransferase involved in cell wall biosynthesis